MRTACVPRKQVKSGFRILSSLVCQRSDRKVNDEFQRGEIKIGGSVTVDRAVLC